MPSEKPSVREAASHCSPLAPGPGGKKEPRGAGQEKQEASTAASAAVLEVSPAERAGTQDFLPQKGQVSQGLQESRGGRGEGQGFEDRSVPHSAECTLPLSLSS